MLSKNKKFILWFSELGIKDVALVGGKNASLGEMYRKLTPKGINIPNGFAITALAYRYLIEKAGIKKQMEAILRELNVHNVKDLMKKSKQIRQLINQAPLPPELSQEIAEAYHKLCRSYGPNTDVAVRSSATAEDLPSASFAGQQETFLNIRGEKELMQACQKCFASLFTSRAISYRADQGFDHLKVYLSIGIQKMVRSDLASSGVIFSIDTESGFENAILITGSYGLGETVVQGEVNPDEFYVFKPTLKKGYQAIISKTRGAKQVKMIYNTKGKAKTTKIIPTTLQERISFILSDQEVFTLARWAVKIEEHYSKPMDIEWAKDGKTKQLFIIQARPETVQSQKKIGMFEDYEISNQNKALVAGKSVGSKIGQGKVRVIQTVKEISLFKPGEVLVTTMTDPDWEPIMKIAAAIVTDQGGRTCHAAIVSREMGIPCIVGAGEATRKLKTGQLVTVSCAEGEEGHVYEGKVAYKIVRHNLKKLPHTKTKVMLNVGDPERAFEFSFIPNDGVGLAREEFIINSYITIHPLALLHPDKIDQVAKRQIEKLTVGYKNKVDFYVDRLAFGIALITAAFYPKPVILRFSDFKTNEYANLIGGKFFEPVESNPMIGWRGASRYHSEGFRHAFALECRAVKKVREEMGLTNLKVMVPFCRTIEEGKKALKELHKNGIVGIKFNQMLPKAKKLPATSYQLTDVYVMCEIPANVILADEFTQLFDGFSIGSNDLTQLILGVDRDSALVAYVYDERNAAVKKMIAQVIKICRKNKTKIGLCGQAPSDFPDFAEFLVQCGIDSISLDPDTAIKTAIRIAKAEKKR